MNSTESSSVNSASASESVLRESDRQQFTGWINWYMAQSQSLTRRDFVYLRHYLDNWKQKRELLCYARGAVQMNRWPEELEVTERQMSLRLSAFRALRIHFAIEYEKPVEIRLGGWVGLSVDARNAHKLISSLRAHHRWQMHVRTARLTLTPEFFVLALISLLLLWTPYTVIFGVGCAVLTVKKLLVYFDSFVEVEKNYRDALLADENNLRRVLAEVIELREEISIYFDELKTLEKSLESDVAVYNSAQPRRGFWVGRAEGFWGC